MKLPTEYTDFVYIGFFFGLGQWLSISAVNIVFKILRALDRLIFGGRP